MFRMGKWGAGNKMMAVYRYDDEKHKHRMGNCDFLPKDGDLCVCIKSAGDCFDDYIVIRKRKDQNYVKRGKFGAYAFGESCCELTERKFHLLMAGEPVDLRD